jgi:hypothetical protein
MPLILREEQSLRMSKNAVLRGVFGPKCEEGRGGWRKLHNEKLYSAHILPNTTRMIKSKKQK